MKTLWKLCLVFLSVVTPCAAQTTPAWDFFGGYSFERSDLREYFKSTPIIYAIRDRYANVNGLEASVTENVNRWLGGTLDISGHYKTPVLSGTTNSERMYSILYGPRFSYRTPLFTPFAHVMVGAVHEDVKVTPTGPHASDLGFGMALGGGLDLKIGRTTGVRLLQLDYFRATPLGTRPHSYRAAAGVIFYLGARRP